MDSLGQHGRKYGEALRTFLRFQGIKRYFFIQFPPVPQQRNNYDCGVFLLQLAELIFDGRPVDRYSFTQRDATEFRDQITRDLTRGLREREI
jgi:Ulp1 family protease